MKKLLFLLLLSPMFLFSQKKVVIKGTQLSISSLAPMASFSIVANATGSPATPTAVPLAIGLKFYPGVGLGIDTANFKDTIFAVNGLQIIGASFNTIGLGGRLQQATNISLANLYSLTIDSAQTGAGKGFRVNYGSDAGWDISVRDSATQYWTWVHKGTPGQVLTMLSTGGIGWGAGGGGATPSWDATLAVNNITGRTVEQDKISTLGTGQIWYLWKPKDYGSTAGNGTVGQYLSYMDDSFVDGTGTRDHVFSWHSYNYPAPGFSPVADAAYSFRAERNYHQGTNNFEFHIPEIKTSGGALARLISLYGDRDLGHFYENNCMDAAHWFTIDDQLHEWFTYGAGPTRAVDMSYDGRWGSGGVAGTQANDIFFHFYDGSGAQSTWQMSGANVVFRPANDYAIFSPLRHMDIQPSGHFNVSNSTFDFGFDFGTGEMRHKIQSVNGYSHTWYSGVTLISRLNYTGQWTFNGYGVGAFAGTATKNLQADASGNIIEGPVSISATATLDFPSTTSTTVSDLTITVTGAAVGDVVAIGVPNGSTTTTGEFTGWVSASNTVKIRYSPKATEDPASGTFKATVIK